MTLANVIKFIDQMPDSWVRVEHIRKISNGLELCFGIHKGKSGRKTDSWSVTCLGVRELHVTDLDGGGLRLYSNTHPAARQYSARTVELRWTGISDQTAAIGALYGAHTDLTDDWIPFDRYADIRAISSGKFICRGPDALMRAYAKALRAKGGRVKVTIRGTSKAKLARPKVLHFGESFVISDAFSARRIGEISAAADRRL